jgi:hypothetical protein
VPNITSGKPSQVQSLFERACEDGKEKRRELAREGGAKDVTAKLIAWFDQPDDPGPRTWLLLSSLNGKGTLVPSRSFTREDRPLFPSFFTTAIPDLKTIEFVCKRKACHDS